MDFQDAPVASLRVRRFEAVLAVLESVPEALAVLESFQGEGVGELPRGLAVLGRFQEAWQCWKWMTPVESILMRRFGALRRTMSTAGGT